MAELTFIGTQIVDKLPHYVDMSRGRLQNAPEVPSRWLEGASEVPSRCLEGTFEALDKQAHSSVDLFFSRTWKACWHAALEVLQRCFEGAFKVLF